nr:hypothetical protein [Tanacetum cinerariifolium]
KAYNLDLQHLEKVLSMQDIDEEEPVEVEEVLEVVTTAKLMIEVVTTASPTTTVAQVKLKMMYPFLLHHPLLNPTKSTSQRNRPIAPKVPFLEASLEHQLPSPSNDPIPDADKDSLKFQELMDLCTRLSNKVLGLESEVIDIKFSFTDKITKLKDKVHKLEEENRVLKEKSFKSAKIDTATPVEDKEESFKHERMIADMDEDVEVNLAQAKAYNLDLQHLEKVLSMQDIDEEEPVEVEEVLEVVTTAKLMIEVVTTASPTTTVAQVPK